MKIALPLIIRHILAVTIGTVDRVFARVLFAIRYLSGKGLTVYKKIGNNT